METRNMRPEMHIAQQSRRERLRIQQQMNINDQNQNMELYSNNTVDHHHQQQQHQQEINTDDAVLFQRLRFGNLSYNNPLVFTSETVNFTSQSQALLGQSSTSKDVNLVNNQESSSSTKINGDPQNFNTWKSIGSHETRDSWAVGMEGHGNNNNNNTTMIVGDLSYMNQNSYDNQHVRFSLADGSTSTMPSRIGQKHYRDVQFDSHPVTYDSGMATFARKSCHVPWTSEGVVSAYAERVEARGHTSVFSNESANAQGLALSLSSMPLTKQNQCRIDEKTSSQDLIMSNNNYATLCSKPPNSMFVQKSSAGPLGPFTGYDTILKTSKFLTPAQQLLHDICLSASPEKSNTSYVKDLHEIRPFDDDDDDGSLIEPVDSNQKTQEASRNGSFRPEFLQKKEKLVHMQEEVGRRYKHYHQQMQMVYSSFESVAGLTAATPYISLALKTISRLFHSVRNAISQHLKTVRKALGEDFSSSSNNNNKCDTNSSSSMFKLIDNNNNKQKVGVNNNLGLFEAHQQHVWRPQRGLPERAVAVLRAWLFDHFLHPYPTDSDKHMLASQTGLTRNQVSNWFINARVRIWKPMVEEIHSLESKTAAETASNVVKNDVKTVTDASSCSNDSHQLLNPVQETGFSGKQQQVEFPCIAGSGSGFHGNPTMNVQTWGNHNRSVVAAGFVPYIQNGMDLGGGLGAVSLTLGLRQNVVGNIGQHSSHQQAGNQIVYDFVG